MSTNKWINKILLCMTLILTTFGCADISFAEAVISDDWYTLSDDGGSVSVSLSQYVDDAYWNAVISDTDVLETGSSYTDPDGTGHLELQASGKDGAVSVVFEDRIEGRQSIFSAYELELTVDNGKIRIDNAQKAWYVLYPDTNRLEIWIYADESTGYEWTYTSDSDCLYTSDTTFEASENEDGSGCYYTRFGVDIYDETERYVTLRLIYGYGVFRDIENVQALTRTMNLYVGGDGTLGVLGYSDIEDYADYLRGESS